MNTDAVNSVGDLLREARESKGLTLDAAHQATKISVRVLSSLEQDDFETFESDIYLRGFLKNYASYLGLDSRQVMQTLDSQLGSGPAPRGTLWEIEETITEERLKSPRLFRRFVVPLLIITIIILTLLFVRERRRNTGNTQGHLQSETIVRSV